MCPPGLRPGGQRGLQRFQVLDESSPLGRIWHPEFHIVARDQPIRVFKPFIEKLFLPDNTGIAERVGIRKLREGTSPAAEHSAKSRALLIHIQRMATGASPCKEISAGGCVRRQQANSPDSQ